MPLSHIHAEHYQDQLNDKISRLTEMFADLDAPELEVFESDPLNYRMRAEFRVWHEGEDLYYIMFNPETRSRYRVDQFPAASLLVNRAMAALIENIKENDTLRRKLYQVDFLSTLSGEILISLIYHRQIGDEWQIEAEKLKEKLTDQGFTVNLIGRARKIKIDIERDYVVERLNVHGRDYIYQQIENSFTQPNGHVAEKMLSWAVDISRESTGDLLELYCGNGNFSLALAQNFDRVLATELAKPSVESAQFNIAANKIENVKIIRMSSEDFTLAMKGVKTFRRLKDSGVDLKEYRFTTVFVDPPRSGMDEETCRMVQEYDRIIYISCNPDTLKQNMEILGETHSITKFALFDQFPYTHHMEAGVLLERR
jgi:tRNA (uracil-5-)-methyltransferase